ncbi:MAG: RNA polymerase sigma factor [Prevotella sp.]|jgi:RNA polymerase sigma-70 factor (ECF subfamily)|nr:RNA polymerase sigma factor [Prevotella sp.]MBR4698596.1 RNA polymerase sigma factor [Prevotella sp.]
MSIDDKEIVKQLEDPKTQRKAFSLIVSQYTEPLYWKIRRIVLTHDDANDVLQNVFIKAWTNIGDFQNKSKLSTWLYRIAINESLDFLRKQKAASAISADEDVSVANRLMADEYFDGDETEAQLQEAIAKLPDVQRTVFNLRYFDEMKYSEMSKLLDTSEGALKASYHLAVKKITEFFKSHD